MMEPEKAVDILNGRIASLEQKLAAAVEAIRQLREGLDKLATEHHILACADPVRPTDFRKCPDGMCSWVTSILEELR